MKRLIALGVTVLLLGILYTRVDREALRAGIAATRMDLFLAAIAMFIPQTLVQALRWRWLVGLFTPLGWGEAISLILASQTMNLVLPSKAGDLTKAVFLKQTGTLDLKRSTNIVVFEKMLDVAALALLMILGVALLFVEGQATAQIRAAAVVAVAAGLFAVTVVAVLYLVPPDAIPGLRRGIAYCDARPKLQKFARLFEASHETITLLQSRGARRGRICLLSLAIWLLHLGQIYLFFLSLSPAMTAPTPLGQFASLVPLAIFIGLLPLTIAGFGTRDAALVIFFPQHPKSLMLVAAMFVNIRYILPALVGLPFLGRYIAMRREGRG